MKGPLQMRFVVDARQFNRELANGTKLLRKLAKKLYKAAKLPYPKSDSSALFRDTQSKDPP